MRTSIGGLSIFQIVVIFILIFTGIMCLTINQSKAFAVKDKIITIIQNDGLKSIDPADFSLTGTVADEIAVYLAESGYTITGPCPDSSYQGYDRNGNQVGGLASFCIRTNVVSDNLEAAAQSTCPSCNVATGDYPKMIYYDVVVFYQLDIPVIQYLFNFKINGSTRVLVKE